jgi:RHS repeat-associated protein
MLYNARDRLVLTQDGNQTALSTPQWTASLYDELDRLVVATLYNTSKSVSSLQTDINNAVTISPASSGVNQVTGIDLYINQRQTNISRYAATNSIQFASDANGSFSCGVNDEFAAEIDPNAGQFNSVATTAFTSPISTADLSDPNVTTILKYVFYDNYSFGPVKPFNTGFTNLSAYSTSDPNVMPIAASKRTVSMATGAMTRVLNTASFLSSTLYYDEDGSPIQTLEDNIKGGTDITTRQYHFDGRMLSICNSHTTSGTGYTNFITLNKYNFDKLGRVTSIQKQLGSNAFKTIASYDYDDFAHVKTKHLDPDYTNATRVGLESLNYSFNIHNQITGINKDYALKNPANYNKWEHFFGMYLSFDNRDNIFSKGLLNGQVSGIVWNTQGDDAQRKYEYTYDNANRLINAIFTEQQHPGDGWTNNKMDFSVSGSGGKITYDGNGNLLNMLQKGVQPGNASPIVIDNLNYVYSAYSNKLQSVTDQMTATNVNGLFGDFKDGNNGSTADYVYDNNGNVVIDLNKNAKDLGNVAGANGIHYNYLDKPDEIRIPGKGTIKIVYNADGEKLQRIYTPEVGNATTTTYINQFVYQATGTGSDALAFINMEEGRIRVITPITQNNGYDAMAIDGNLDLPNGKKGVYDYFIKDYQENVRMVLTEETHSAYNTCTMETGRSSAEDPVFGQTGSGNEVEITRYPTPAGWKSVNTSASVSRLGNTAGHNIGPNTLQKVMAGDQVSTTVQYYYQSVATGSNPNFVSTLLTSLGLAIAGSPIADNVVKANTAGITSGLNGTSGFVNAVQPTGAGGTTPKAYLTILFFDERFKFVEAVDGGVAQQQVAASGSGAPPLALGNIKAPKNGYVYVYVSNQSDQDVYFDSLQVGITRGNIIEENHYYAYGLKIAAISSQKPADVNEGKLKNDYLYNVKELFDDADLNWYDYGFRNYDPQIGRFVQIDPLTDDYPFLSTYLYAGDDPINKVDVDGLFGGIATSFETVKDLASVEVVGHATRALTASVNMSRVALNVTSISIQVAVRVSSSINGSFSTDGTGGGGKPKPGATGGKPKPGAPSAKPVPKLGVGVDDDDSFWSNMWAKQKRGWWLAWKRLKEGAQQLRDNFHDNWHAGRDPYHKFMAEPMMYSSPMGLEGEAMSAFGEGEELMNLSNFESEATMGGAGVYDLGTSLGKYIGQSKDIMKRVTSHFAKGGKLSAGELENAIFHSMPGSTKLQREVYEQFLINKYGINNILNVRNPMGGRMDLYNSMIDDVIKQFNLPR